MTSLIEIGTVQIIEIINSAVTQKGQTLLVPYFVVTRILVCLKHATGIVMQWRTWRSQGQELKKGLPGEARERKTRFTWQSQGKKRLTWRSQEKERGTNLDKFNNKVSKV